MQECPTGMVDEDSFKHIFAQFFPQGGKFYYTWHSILILFTLHKLVDLRTDKNVKFVFLLEIIG